MRLSLLAIALLLMAVLGRAASAHGGPGFDLFLFVRSYGPGFCSEEECSMKPPSAFTIHGLWPENRNGSWPEFCQGAPARASSAAAPPRPASAAAMACEWPSFKGGDAAFHDHEWARHGTCAEPVLGGRAAFFQRVLKLNAEYDLNAALDRANILPSNSRSYSRAALVSAVRRAYGVAPLLSCASSRLVEVWMCMDLRLKPMSCPRAVANRPCPDTVLLPQGAPVSSSCKSFFPPSLSRSARAASSSSSSSSAGGSLAVAGARKRLAGEVA